MRHHGTKSGTPAARHGYTWYDAETGAIDRCALAAEATRRDPLPTYEQVPAWLTGIPACLPDATAVDLARLDATARRLFLHSGGEG